MFLKNNVPGSNELVIHAEKHMNRVPGMHDPELSSRSMSRAVRMETLNRANYRI